MVKKKTRNIVFAGSILAIALLIIFSVGGFQFQVVQPTTAISIYNQKIQWNGQYEYFAAIGQRCQEPPSGMGAVSYTGFVIWNTPADLQIEKAEVIKTVTGGFDSGVVTTHDALYGTWTSTDNDYSPSTPITNWGFALPSTGGNAQSTGCEYKYHVVFVNPNAQPTPPACVPNVVCEAWSACTTYGTQTRNCDDGCGTMTVQSQSCLYQIPPANNTQPEPQPVQEQPDLTIVLIAAVISVGILGVTLYSYFKKKGRR